MFSEQTTVAVAEQLHLLMRLKQTQVDSFLSLNQYLFISYHCMSICVDLWHTIPIKYHHICGCIVTKCVKVQGVWILLQGLYTCPHSYFLLLQLIHIRNGRSLLGVGCNQIQIFFQALMTRTYQVHLKACKLACMSLMWNVIVYCDWLCLIYSACDAALLILMASGRFVRIQQHEPAEIWFDQNSATIYNTETGATIWIWDALKRTNYRTPLFSHHHHHHNHHHHHSALHLITFCWRG